jgi:uncharacterized protein (TIGR03067 family)
MFGGMGLNCYIGPTLACGLLLATSNDDAATKDYARLEGVWRFAHVEVNGVKQPDVPFETNKLIVLKGGRYVIVQGPTITWGAIKVDPTKTPKHYDVTVTSGPRKGLTAAGLYELDGDTLTLCFPLRGKERPTAVVSKPGGGCLVHVVRREKQDTKEALLALGRQELTGRWQAVSYALDGKAATEADMKKIQLVFDAEGNSTAYNEGKVFIAANTKIDLSQEPAAIDMSYTEGEPKGKTALGIYKIEDDLLTICRVAPGQARPAEFSSAPGSGRTLMTYKREKAAAK